MPASNKGFTIIEVLIAILLLSIIILLVLGSLNGLFGLSRKSTTQVNASSRTQAVMEEARGQWQNQIAYDRACLNSSTDLSGVTISLQDKDAAGVNMGSTYTPRQAPDCQDGTVTAATGASDPPAPLRAITVTFTTPAGTTSPSQLVLEMSRP